MDTWQEKYLPGFKLVHRASQGVSGQADHGSEIEVLRLLPFGSLCKSCAGTFTTQPLGRYPTVPNPAYCAHRRNVNAADPDPIGNPSPSEG